MLIEWDKDSLNAWKQKRLELLIGKLLDDENPSVRMAALCLTPAGGANNETLVFTRASEMISSHFSRSLQFKFAQIAYIAKREKNTAWNLFLPHVLNNFDHRQKDWQTSFQINSDVVKNIPNLIRQCRPNTSLYNVEMIQKVGFYNKNRDFIYSCYDKNHAADYIHKNLGAYAAKIFMDFPVPQGQSDFFLVAALYLEGGISADVCSVDRTEISPLLQAGDLGIILSSKGLEKKFFFAKPRHPLIKAYLDRMIDYLDRCATGKLSFDYSAFSSDMAFQRLVMDSFCEDDLIFDPARVALIDDTIYAAFVHATDEEESLDHADDHIPFQRARLLGLADDRKLASQLSAERRGVNIVSSLPGYFFAQSNHVKIIGNDSSPGISRQAAEPVASPAVHLFQAYNIGLSGHACLWIGNRFLQLESYLSGVAEQETTNGHWRGPHNANITRVIQEPSIVAYGAGYGCYGHYLVDELPRLGLARKLMGEEAFKRHRIIIPEKTPKWGIELIKTVIGIADDAFLFFDHEKEFWLLRETMIPSYLSRHYQFHPFVKEFYQSVSRVFAPNVNQPFRRLCLSRKSWEPQKSHQRIFLEQERFEAMARERGYDIISPENLSIAEQICLMAETRCQIGEHGSAQHASVYNSFGMTIGIINPLTEVQTNIGRLYGDTDIVAYADTVKYDDKGNTFYSLNDSKILRFLNAVDAADKNRERFYV